MDDFTDGDRTSDIQAFNPVPMKSLEKDIPSKWTMERF